MECKPCEICKLHNDCDYEALTDDFCLLQKDYLRLKKIEQAARGYVDAKSLIEKIDKTDALLQVLNRKGEGDD